jgi:hypothetical protein
MAGSREYECLQGKTKAIPHRTEFRIRINLILISERLGPEPIQKIEPVRGKKVLNQANRNAITSTRKVNGRERIAYTDRTLAGHLGVTELIGKI